MVRLVLDVVSVVIVVVSLSYQSSKVEAVVIMSSLFDYDFSLVALRLL
jgi:hypothetical protein